jgi:hypothetical protein
MAEDEKNFIGVGKDGTEIRYDNGESVVITDKNGNPIVPKKFLKRLEAKREKENQKADHLAVEGLKMDLGKRAEKF